MAAAVLLLVLVPLGYFFGGTVIRIATNKGELVVEVEDPGIEVVVRQNGVVVQDKTAKREFVLTAGDGEIEVVEKEGVKLATKQFQLNRGGKTTVTVTLKELADARKKKPRPPGSGSSPLDALDPAKIPASERFAWQPKELVAVIGEHRQRHWAQVVSVAVRPDGKQVASYGVDGRIRLWDPSTQREQQTSFSGGGKALAYSPDGKRLTDGLAIWDVSGPEPKPLAKLSTEGWYVSGVAFAPDGKTLAACNTDTIKGFDVWLWNLSEAQPLLRARYPNCDGAAFSPDGKTLAVVHHEDQSVRLYDLAEAKPKQRAVLPGQEGKAAVSNPGQAMWALAFAPDGRLATTDPEGIVRLWDVSGKEPKVQATVEGKGWERVVFAANGKRMAIATQFEVQVWGLEGNNVVQKARRAMRDKDSLYGDNLKALAFTPDGETLVTGHLNAAVRFWKVGEEILVEKDPLKPQPATYGPRVVVLPHGPALASLAEDNRLHVWRFGGAIPTEVPVPGDRSLFVPLALTPDGKTLLTNHTRYRGDYTLQLWHVEGAALREAARFEPFPESSATTAAFSPDGKTLAVGGVEQIALWNLGGDAPKERAAVAGQKGRVESLAFSPDGRTLFSFDDDKIVRLWGVADGKLTERGQIKPEGHLMSLAVAPDGKTLVLGTGWVEFWDLSDGKPRKRADSLYIGDVYSLAFSPDGRTLVSAGRELVLWDAATGRKLRECKLPGPVRWAAYAPDGRHLLTANGNGTIYVLRLAPPPAEGAPPGR